MDDYRGIIPELSLACLGCQEFSPIIEDTRTAASAWEEKKYFAGSVVFTCTHYNVCKHVGRPEEVLYFTTQNKK